ncbi:MAG: tetratricopeptide repeat protein, partial [Nitrospirales bacterium]
MKKIWMFSLVGVVLVFNACSAKEKPNFSVQDEHYQQILERQKAGMDTKTQPEVDLTAEMTQGDYEKLGDAHFQQGSLQTAKEQYEKVLSFDPERTSARYKIAVIYLENGSSQEAYDQFHTILDYDLH